MLDTLTKLTDDELTFRIRHYDRAISSLDEPSIVERYRLLRAAALDEQYRRVILTADADRTIPGDESDAYAPRHKKSLWRSVKYAVVQWGKQLINGF
jgi:hypothetical protein